jgi:hypothetical protein
MICVDFTISVPACLHLEFDNLMPTLCVRLLAQLPALLVYVLLTMAPHHVTTYYMLTSDKVSS